jgi:putative DNA primase/helicase
MMRSITQFARIPEAIITPRRFVLWKYEMRENSKGEMKRTKVPYQASRPNCKAKSTAPTTWSSYTAVLLAYQDGHGDGIGFCLGDGWTGVDLDHCIVDGVLSDTAKSIVQKLSTYTEISPSGDGIKMICRGTLPPGRRRDGGIEMYDRGRFFTLTGRELRGVA